MADISSDLSEIESSEKEEGEIDEDHDAHFPLRFSYSHSDRFRPKPCLSSPKKKVKNLQRSRSPRRSRSPQNWKPSPIPTDLRPCSTEPPSRNANHSHEQVVSFKRKKKHAKVSGKRRSLEDSAFDDFDRMAKRFKNRFKDNPQLRLPPLVHSKVPAPHIDIDLSSIPLPLEPSSPKKDEEKKGEGADQSDEELEEESIRMKLALLRSVADQKDPEIAARFAQIQKLLDPKDELDDDDVMFLDEIPLPGPKPPVEIVDLEPSMSDIAYSEAIKIDKDLNENVRECQDFSFSKKSESSADIPADSITPEKQLIDLNPVGTYTLNFGQRRNSEDQISKVKPTFVISDEEETQTTVVKLKEETHLARNAEAQVNQAFKEGWKKFGLLLQDSVNLLKNKKIQSRKEIKKAQHIVVSAGSLVDRLLEKRELVPPWIQKVREDSKGWESSERCQEKVDDSKLVQKELKQESVQKEGAAPSPVVQSIAEEEDEVSLREALLKSLAAKPGSKEEPLPVVRVPEASTQPLEEDEELMRALLLVEISRKARVEKENHPIPKPNPPRVTKVTSMPKIPKVNPVIIQLNAYSDDECDWRRESAAEAARRRKEERGQKLANVLASAKKIKQQGSEGVPIPELSIKLLPESMQQEYQLLKQRLNQLNQRRQARADQPVLHCPEVRQDTNVASQKKREEYRAKGKETAAEVSDASATGCSDDLLGKLNKDRLDVSQSLDHTIGQLRELAAETERARNLVSTAKVLERQIGELQAKLKLVNAEKEASIGKQKSLLESVNLFRLEFADKQRKLIAAEKQYQKSSGNVSQQNGSEQKRTQEKFLELKTLCANLRGNAPKRKPTKNSSSVSAKNPSSPVKKSVPLPSQGLAAGMLNDRDQKVQNGRNGLQVKPAQVRVSGISRLASSISGGKENRNGESESLSSAVVQFQIDPQRVICPHDLHGICKDGQCVFQHLPRPST